ncbi:hypothetical protein EAG18_09650 [Pseudoalteromonas sp. J010]|nr:hypothetical protein EAG18_09650 [Pseudoalteromonas sp. J010]
MTYSEPRDLVEHLGDLLSVVLSKKFLTQLASDLLLKIELVVRLIDNTTEAANFIGKKNEIKD